MSGDIAEIGFRAQTGDLDKAIARLNAIKPAAAAAGQASKNLTSVIEGASASMAQAAYAAAKAEQTKATNAYAAAKASGTASKADLEAAASARKKATEVTRAAKAQRDAITASNAAAAAERKTTAAIMAATSALQQKESVMSRVNRITGVSGGSGRSAQESAEAFNAAESATNPRQFNTGNIAAQFQDIGVTAAMGMNPLTIALQQGTQLSAVLQSMESPLKGIAAAFRQIINPVSLISIGLVALVAAGLQMVDWISVAQGGLNLLADATETVIPYVLGLAATLALVYAPTILAGLTTVAVAIATTGYAAVKAGAQMAAAWILGLGPISLIILAVGTVVTALNIFREEMKQIFGIDFVAVIKEAVNKTIGFFVGFFEGIYEAAKNLPAQLKGEGMSAGEAFAVGFARGMDRDYVGMVADPVLAAASTAADKLRDLAAGIGTGEDKKKKGKTEAERYEDLVKGAQRRIASLEAEAAAVGMSEAAATRLKEETDLLNEAQQKNINLSPAQRAALGQLAQSMTDLQEQTRKTKEALDFMKDTARGFFADMKSGLQQGKTLWESFGDAALNVLNKIADKLMDKTLDVLFEGFSGSGGTGILGEIGSMLFSAKGNVFANDNVQKFAQGGAFTNSIVSKTTPFTFANGGAFGVMGEAGPEAVMPLHRSSNGSLGVRMEGGGSSGVIVNVNNFSNATVTQTQRKNNDGSIEIDVMIDETVADKLGRQGSQSNRALNQFNNRKLITR